MALLDNTAHAMYAAAHGMSSMTSQYHVNLMNSRIMAAATANGGATDPYSGTGLTETSPNQQAGMTSNIQNYSSLSTSSRHNSQSRLNIDADIRIGVGTPRTHVHNDTTSIATQSPPPQSNASCSSEHNENLSSSLEDSSPTSIINNNSSNQRRKRRYDGDTISHHHHELGMTMNLKLEPASSLVSSNTPASLASSFHHAFKPIFGSPPTGGIDSHNMQPDSSSSFTHLHNNSLHHSQMNPQAHHLSNHHMTNNNPSDNFVSTGETEHQRRLKIFGSKADLQLHTQIHMREAKPYKCTQCNKSFANSSYLSQHTRIHLGIKPYKCEICQRKFTQLSHLQQHIRTHTGDKPYKCRHPGCTKAFSQLSNLQSHSRCHQTDKPYKCNSCYKCFVDEQALLEHIPKHKESKHLKTHICQYCGKSYTQETYLAKHMQKHSDRKEPRAPIASMGGTNGTSGQGNGQTNGNNTANTTGGNSLAALGSATSTSSVSQSVVDSYWQKVDPAAYAAHAAHHDRSGDYLGMADPRLNPHAAHQAAAQAVAARDMDMQRDMDAMRHAQLTGGYGDPSGAGVAKTSSAFSPIQGSMLQTAAAAQAAASQGAFAMSAGSRGYSFYDPIGFPKHHSQVGFDSKPGVGGANCFPNQLISLSQIRNYAHQPELLHSLKEK